MKVVHLIDSEGMYGAEKVIYNLLPVLQELNIQVVFGCLSPTNSPGAALGKALEKKNIPVIYLDERKKVSLRGLIDIYNLLKKNRTDILHVHGYKATIIGGMIAQLVGIPFISTYHGEAGRHPELATYVKIETLLLKKAAHVIAVSRQIKNELLSRGISRGKISIVYNGIDDPLAGKRKVIRNIKKECDNLQLLCVGRLIAIKRFDLIIEAIHRLRKDYPNIVLKIAGSGPLESSLKKQIDDLGLKQSVVLIGYVEDMSELYNNTDLFILFSDTEGSPIVLLEAMAFSLPIIASSVGAIPEMVKDNEGAIILPPGNLLQLIQSIKHIIDNPERGSALGNKARDIFEMNYNSRIMASQYIKHYKHCLHGENTNA
jgi:glycosyltransferase involved in cell wall biosynthesis